MKWLVYQGEGTRRSVSEERRMKGNTVNADFYMWWAHRLTFSAGSGDVDQRAFQKTPPDRMHCGLVHVTNSTGYRGTLSRHCVRLLKESVGGVTGVDNYRTHALH